MGRIVKRLRVAVLLLAGFGSAAVMAQGPKCRARAGQRRRHNLSRKGWPAGHLAYVVFRLRR